MDLNTLLKILRQGEGETVEFKSSFGQEAIESLVAFASSKGGMLFVGVTNKGNIIGTETGDETVQNWINRIKQVSSPSIIPDVEIVHFERKKVVVFSIISRSKFLTTPSRSSIQENSTVTSLLNN